MSKSRRPAERQLIVQFEEERDALLDGFGSRREVLRWGQRIAVRTLGQLPQRRFHQLAKSFVPDEEYMEGVLLAAFLDASARTRDLDEGAAENVRERWAADVLGPVQVRAFRDLRKDAGEYIGEDEDDESGYDPAAQDFVMRPALSELDDYQQKAMDMVLGGLNDRSQILKWGDVLTTATRGEPIDPERGAGTFVPKCYREPSTVDLLTRTTPAYRRAREAFVAHWLLPAFNRGVRDLAGRTTEEPGDESEGYGPGEVA
ncbi:hypothetical protein [Halorhabdus sp. CUG00001]|uniref:hypothetical protein n=1 Tax=Halorhabdus sp. CUG00001 TaxID=2600297 RepID=UPI00131AE103|nr:hypothetical protein [Halorhabdus sp. CUG00001]